MGVKDNVFPSTFAGGLKELLRMPMRSQGYCGDGSGLSGKRAICGGPCTYVCLEVCTSVSTPVICV